MFGKLAATIICLFFIGMFIREEVGTQKFELFIFYCIFYLTLPVLVLIGAYAVIRLVEKSDGHNQ
jgi:hypothetical protein